jgi:hypothetical protein
MKTIEITLPLANKYGDLKGLKTAQAKIKALKKIGFKVERNIGGMAVILTK